jgi:hypothetical protein
MVRNDRPLALNLVRRSGLATAWTIFAVEPVDAAAVRDGELAVPVPGVRVLRVAVRVVALQVGGSQVRLFVPVSARLPATTGRPAARRRPMPPVSVIPAGACPA